MKIDFGRTASDYVRHRVDFPSELFNRLNGYGVGLADQCLLDIGAGTGSLARNFARRGCKVFALDASYPLLAAGRLQAGPENRPIAWINARAECVPLASGTFDVITAGQCWHWFDRSVAAREVRRLLKEDGHLVIAHFDWLPLPDNVVEASERLIQEHNPDWSMGGGTGLYPAWLGDMAVAGFVAIESLSFDVPVVYRHLAWRGRLRASAGVAASLSPPQVAAFDAALADLLIRRFPADPLVIPHRVFLAIGRKPARS